MGFVPSAASVWAGWHELLTVKCMCDKKYNKKGLKFHDIAAILVEKPHIINFCRNCCNLRLTESGETKVTNAVQTMSLETDCRPLFRFRVRWIHPKNVGAIHSQKEVGNNSLEEATKAV